MASLAQTIKTNTGLASMSAEELAAQSGRAPSTSPMETGVLGGNPDQAKMANTPNQQASAIRTAIQGTNDLATAERTGQPKATASAADKAEIAKGKGLSGLSGLGDRVDALVADTLKAAGTAAPTATLKGNSVDPEVNRLLEVIRKNPNDTAAIATLNKKLGNTTPGSLLTGDQLIAQYAPADSAIATAFGKSVGEAITAGKLPIQQFGFKDINAMAAALGTDPVSLQKLSIPDLIDQINKVIDTEFQQTSNLEAQANDPRLGPAERAQARKQLRDMGAIGIKSAESDMDKLADQVADDDQITFNGEQIPVSELLNNEYLSGVIAHYLDGVDPKTGKPLPENEFSTKFAKSNPELVQFINKNMAALKAAGASISAGAKQLAEAQEKNKQVATGKSGESLPDEMMKKLFPDWGSLRTAPYDISSYPLLQLMNDPNITAEQSSGLVKFSNEIFKQYPQFANEFAKMSRDQLTKIGALGDTAAYARFKDKLDEVGKVRNMKTPDDMARILGLNSASEMESLRQKIIQGVNFGTINPAVLDSLPGFKDGKFDITFKYLKSKPMDNLNEIVKNMDSFQNMTTAIRANSMNQLPGMPGKVADIFKTKSQIDTADIPAFDGASTSDMIKFAQQNPNKFTPQGRAAFDTYVKQKFNTETDKIIQDTTGRPLSGYETAVHQAQYSNEGQVRQDQDAIQKMIDDITSKAAADGVPREYYASYIDRLAALKGSIKLGQKGLIEGKIPVVPTHVQQDIDNGQGAYVNSKGHYITADEYDMMVTNGDRARLGYKKIDRAGTQGIAGDDTAPAPTIPATKPVPVSIKQAIQDTGGRTRILER